MVIPHSVVSLTNYFILITTPVEPILIAMYVLVRPLCLYPESNSNLNYKFVIVCSKKISKMFLRCTNSGYITEPSKVLDNSTPYNEY